MPEPLTDPTDIRRYSNALRLMSERRIEGITQRLIDGEIDLAAWQEAMKAELRRANYEQFVVGKGGDRTQINRQEYLQLGPELKRQYRYLQRFSDEIAQRAADGKPIGGITERAKLYARSTQAMMWRSAIPVKLEQVPRDGQTKCRTNCQCRLVFEYERAENGVITAVLVYWKLRPAEHCSDCLDLSRIWNPLRKEIALSEAGTLEQAVDLLLLEAHDLNWEERRVIAEMWRIDDAVPVK